MSIVRITPVIVLSALTILAQMNTGEASGIVLDETNSALSGATIVARSLGSGQTFTRVCGNSGQYWFSQLPPGSYSLTVYAINFRQSVLPSVEVHAGDRLRQDFTLRVSDSTGVVTVVADASSAPANTAEIRDLISHKRVVDLPLKGRQFLDLAMLSQGVVRPPGGTRGDAMQQAGELVNVLGQRSGHNLYLLDGVAITDEHFNNMVIAPSVDAIEEVSIQKTSYAPEFGGKSGAVINVISRSGSNEFHGSLFEFFRNDVLDARNFFDAGSTPPFRQNQFGGSVGGPIRSNRTFFFLSYESKRVRKSLTQRFSVPTPAMRAGDFSALPAIYDPLSTAGDGRRAQFPNNQVPAARLDPVATELLAHVPLPNLSGSAQNLLATEGQRLNADQYGARVDHQLSQADSLYFRASLFDARQADPFGSSVLQETLLPGFGRNLSTHAINGVVGLNHTFSSNFLNELRFGFLTVNGGQTSPNAGNDFAERTGLRGVTTNTLDMGYPQFSSGGQFTTMGDPALFTFRKNFDLELYDNVIWHRSGHTIRFGGYLMHYRLRPVNPNGSRGIFSFTPRWTSSAAGLADGGAFADLLLGYPTTAQVGLGRAAMNASTDWGHFYIQDSWQATRRLTFDAGLRYEYNRNMTDSDNQIAAIDTTIPGGRFVIASDDSEAISPAAKSLLPFLPVPWVSSAAAGWNRSLLVSRPLRFAPRAGLSWTLPGSANTVLRAGFGVYPNQAAYSIVTNMAQNLPFFVTRTVNSTPGLMPSFTTQNALTVNTIGTVGGNNLNHNFQIEYNEVWNLNIERSLRSHTTLGATYIGSRTVHADSGTVTNVPFPGPGPIASRRPVPELSQISEIRWNGWATYNALTLAARRQFDRGIVFDMNWTWSHSMDDASDPGATLNETNLPQNVYDLHAEKASSSFDHRHRIVASVVCPIPYPGNINRWMDVLFRGWQTAAIFTAQSGAPLTVNLSSDQANTGAGPAQRPNILGDPNNGPRTPQQWFNTSAFGLPALYTFGNSPRNAVNGPPLQELDFSLKKEIRISEAVRLNFRAEAYNLLNHSNFNIPNRTAFTANFGSISSAQDSPQLQLAFRLAF